MPFISKNWSSIFNKMQHFIDLSLVELSAFIPKHRQPYHFKFLTSKPYTLLINTSCQVLSLSYKKLTFCSVS